MNGHFMPQMPFASALKCILKGLHRALNYTLELFGIRRELQSVNLKLGLALTPLLIALLLPACAVINPNVTLTRPDSTTKQHTPAQGIKYAEDAIKEYDYHISSNNWFRGTTGVLMIGASAAALALGITDGGTTAITALGVSGASLFGIGTFLSDSSRNAIYNDGKEKVICAIAAVQPLFLSQKQIEKFKKSLETINTEIGNVQSNILNVTFEKNNSTNEPLKALAQKQIDSAQATIVAARAAYEAGTKLDLQLSRAGNALITGVDGINAEVNKRLAGTVSSLEAANTIIGGLATVTSNLTTIPNEARAQGKSAQEKADQKSFTPKERGLMALQDSLSEALNALAESNGELGSAVSLVGVIADEIGQSLGNLGQCKLNIQELTLTVKPESIEFTKGTAGIRRLIILSGKKPFAAQLLEQSDVDTITIDQPVPFGSTVDVKYDGSDATGKYTVHIVDGAERNVFIEILLKEPEPNPSS